MSEAASFDATIQRPLTTASVVWALRAILAGSVLLAFGLSMWGTFVGWDDTDLIVQNRKVNPPTLSGFAQLWRGADHQMYIPVVYSTWWALAHVAGDGPGRLNAFAFHATNVLIHVVSALAVFEILRLLIRRPLASFAGALLFSVHPIQTEAVAWATGLKDVLSGGLALLAIWQFLLALRGGRSGRYAIASLLFLPALLAKPSTVCVPVICAVLMWLSNWGKETKSLDAEDDGTLLSSGVVGQRSGKIAKTLLVAPVAVLIAWLVASAGVAVVAGKVQPIPVALATSISSRPLIAADALVWYAKSFVVPVNFAVDYSRTPAMVLHSGWAGYEALAVVIALACVAILRRKILIAAALLFLIALLPVLGFTPFVFQRYSTVADRYAYLAMLGPALACGAMLSRFDARKWLAPAAILATVLIVLSIRQTIVWHGTNALFSHTLEVNPTSLAATRSLGFFFAERHDDAQAAAYFELANQNHPEDSTNHFNYANLFLRHGLLDQAIWHYQSAIQIDPTNAQYAVNYGVALATAGRNQDALDAFDQATRLDPGSADAWQNAGLMLEKLGRGEEAKSAFLRALKCDPTRVIAQKHLSNLK